MIAFFFFLLSIIQFTGLSRANFVHVLAQEGKTEELEALINKTPSVVHEKAGFGETPLIDACKFGHSKAALLLLDRNADINAKDTIKWTALHYACLGGHDAIALLLIERGANIYEKNNENKTPLDLLTREEDKVRMENYSAGLHELRSEDIKKMTTMMIEFGMSSMQSKAYAKQLVINHDVASMKKLVFLQRRRKLRPILKTVGMTDDDIEMFMENMQPMLSATEGTHKNIQSLSTAAAAAGLAASKKQTPKREKEL